LKISEPSSQKYQCIVPRSLESNSLVKPLPNKMTL
jgi:hypothetical protein